jgi:hypothetical protein
LAFLDRVPIHSAYRAAMVERKPQVRDLGFEVVGRECAMARLGAWYRLRTGFEFPPEILRQLGRTARPI